MKRELSTEEKNVIEAFKQSLIEGFTLKSTTPVKKMLEGQPHYTMWVTNEANERFLVYSKNSGDLKYIPEKKVNELRKKHCLITLK